MSGAKQKLKISRFDTDAGAAAQPTFTALLNPSGYTRTSSVRYSRRARKLDSVLPQDLTLEDLVFDGTGVVPVPDGTPQTVEAQIDALRSVVFAITQGDKVRKPVVELVWGSLYFLGRLETMTVKYTLFKPSGAPLRARVTLKFNEYEKEYESQAASDSDTMTRQLQINAGDSLPKLCFNAYQDPGLVETVARFNNLTSFRNVAPGEKLVLPKVR